MQEELQIEASQVVADTGYANEEQILALEEDGNFFAILFKCQDLFFIGITCIGNDLGYFYLKFFLHGMNRRLKIFKVIRMVGNLHRTYQMVLGIYHRLNIVSRNEAVTGLHQTSFGISGKAPFRTFIQHTLFFGLKLFNLLA